MNVGMRAVHGAVRRTLRTWPSVRNKAQKRTCQGRNEAAGGGSGCGGGAPVKSTRTTMLRTRMWGNRALPAPAPCTHRTAWMRSARSCSGASEK